jgi:DNA-binding transcriptional LysR family regulator
MRPHGVVVAPPALNQHLGFSERREDLPARQLVAQLAIDGLIVPVLAGAAALRGAGIVLLPSFIVRAALTAGRLVPVLPGYRVPELGIYAVYPHSRHLSAKVRSFVDFLIPRFGDKPIWDAWMSNSANLAFAGQP